MSEEIVKTLGGERLGSGNKTKVAMHNFERSTHNMSRIWKSSMNVGTLIPCFKEIGLPGDSFDIDIDSLVKTQATSAPLFGSFKMQVDLFMCPIRLYNGWLHNNMLGIGLKMSNVKLPYINHNQETTQLNSSCLGAYLGTRGVTKGQKDNALGVLSYLDIFKNYYSNKQEDRFYAIGKTNYNFKIVDSSLVDGFSNDWEGEENLGIWWINPVAPIASGNEPSVSDILELMIKFAPTATKDDIQDLVYKSLKITFYNGNAVIGEVNPPNMRKYLTYDTYTYPGVPTPAGALHINTPLMLQDSVVANVKFTRIVISPVEYKVDVNIRINNFKLKELDDVRDRCLSTNGWEFSEKSQNSISIARFMTEKGYSDTPQGGILLKTYQSDIFNNWLSEETVTGTNGIAAVTAVSTSGGKFTIDSLLLANKVYNMLNRIAVSGGTYDDWQEVVYGVNQSWRAESPIYLGGMSREIYFSEVVSTADSTAEGAEVPLGSLAGKGEQGDKRGGFVSFKVNEPSLIMGIVSITPRIDYSQGNWWANSVLDMDQWHKPSLDGIGFQDLMCSQMLWSDKRSAGKQPAWLNYMTAINENFGDFAAGESLEMMVLNRNYTKEGDVIKDLTTYIDPKKFNYIFADDDLAAQNFWMQLAFNVTARRKMSAKVMPNL